MRRRSWNSPTKCMVQIFQKEPWPSPILVQTIECYVKPFCTQHRHKMLGSFTQRHQRGRRTRRGGISSLKRECVSWTTFHRGDKHSRVRLTFASVFFLAKRFPTETYSISTLTYSDAFTIRGALLRAPVCGYHDLPIESGLTKAL